MLGISLQCIAASDFKTNDFFKISEDKNYHNCQKHHTSGLNVATYCVRYPRAMPFLRHKIPHSLLHILSHMPFRGRNIPNVLNLEKLGVKIHNYALLLALFAYFLLDRTHALIF